MYKIQANEERSGFHCYFSDGENRFYADITDFPFGQKNRAVKVNKRALNACNKEIQESKEGV